jgi:hypothetical protein
MEAQLEALSEIQERLRRLEKENRRFKQIGGVTLIFVVAAIVMGQAPATQKVVKAEEIDAHSFVLKDRSGTKKGIWHYDKDGSSALEVYSADGQDSLFTPHFVTFSDSHAEAKAILGLRDGLRVFES